MRLSTVKTERIERAEMTPMIDIVFQLLIFFIMTFKIVSQKGDFMVKMPLNGSAIGDAPPIVLRLEGAGELTRISMGDREFSDINQVHQWVVGHLGDEHGPAASHSDVAVEIDCDYNLRYEHVIAAITAVTGYIDEDESVVELIDNIRLSPTRIPEGNGLR